MFRLVYVLIAAFFLPTFAFAEPMSFRSVSNGGNMSNCCWIVAEGEITDATPAAFDAFIKQEISKIGSASREIRIVGNGDDVEAGLVLGQKIRDGDFITTVGKSLIYSEPWFERIDEGDCIAACAYAFLGGAVRSVPSGTRLGFGPYLDIARLFDTDERTISIDEERHRQVQNQITTGKIVEYIYRMGVGAALYPLAASVQLGADARILTPEELMSLGIENADDTAGPWKADSLGEGLFSEIRTRNSGRILSLICHSSNYYIQLTVQNGALDDIQTLMDAAGPSFFLETQSARAEVNLRKIGKDNDGESVYLMMTTNRAGAEIIASARSIRPVSKVSLPRVYSTPFHFLFEFTSIYGDIRLPKRTLKVCA
ncbi:hypothetical protein [uncultured Hoeflea sp.]|uniref:COG3904 family protein n=1 Tax=uncultured Hoeflea sp. TaxID=538666 RepID=UPI0030ED0071